MSYLVLVIILLIMLSLISLFNTVSERIKSTKQRFFALERQKRYEQAMAMRGHLHRMNPEAFQKWVADLYEEQGYRTRTLPNGEERSLLLEKEGAYVLVGPSNYVWPVSQLVLERLYNKKNAMGLDNLIVISTSGFNASAVAWAKEGVGIVLMSEEGLFDLCRESAYLAKNKILQPQTVS